jgi:dipeptidyl aminopeptidase/acylaminoacyl peptidase
MNKLVLLFVLFAAPLSAQLSLDQIMADPNVSVGALPSNFYWSEDSKTVYFYWNPTLKTADSLYAVDIRAKKPYPVSSSVRQQLPAPYGAYDAKFDKKVYIQNGDLMLYNCRTKMVQALTNTVEDEQNPSFNAAGDKVIFKKGDNLFSLQLSNGALTQLSNLQYGSVKPPASLNEQEKWLKKDQLALFEVLDQRSQRKNEGERNEKNQKSKRPKLFYLDEKRVQDLQISPSEQFITWTLVQSPKDKGTIVPSFVTESGFTTDLPTRSKVGGPQARHEFYLYDRARDSIYTFDIKQIDGIYDLPDYVKDYRPAQDTIEIKKGPLRKVQFSAPIWSADSKFAVLVVNSIDNKDRWILQLDPTNGTVKTLDRQRDEAWIDGPIDAIGFLADQKTLYYQSEADGYAHLYTINLSNGVKTQLTKGKFEVQTVQLSRDMQWFYLRTNEVHPGEQHFYKMSVKGGERIRLTTQAGANQAQLAPDGNHFAFLYSSATQPWELFVQENRPDAKAEQITFSQSAQFKSYAWRTPKIVTFTARDGAPVYARLYESEGKKGEKPAVIFVHGAGYLQNAHRWWSRYFRENMFHNFLVEQGYTVLDIDYRGSAGYGRDWRTGIYRHMGGKDLDDQVDGAKWLVAEQGVDAKRIGIYGGSYGGFITLMGLFTTPDMFAAGAALRPVTDWAAYNHGYTSNILNEPYTDSIAYRRSSPIYHAAGLKGHLLICHGMIDTNVHFQDVVRLSQRLIELKKDNWELAVYPLEDHGFVEPSSWLDEYKRIFRLFETHLK